MKILSVKQLENSPGPHSQEIHFDENITESFILRLGIMGQLRYYKDFPLPFFKITIARRFEIKGIEGKNSIKIHLKNPNEFNLHDVIDLLTRIECDYPESQFEKVDI